MNINSTWKPLRLLTTSEKMAALPRFPLISLWWNIILRACILYLHSVLLFLLLTSSSSSSPSSSHSIRAFLYSIITWSRLWERELSAMNQFQALLFFLFSERFLTTDGVPALTFCNEERSPRSAGGGFLSSASRRMSGQRCEIQACLHCSGKFNLP